jgi:hypothetical protein
VNGDTAGMSMNWKHAGAILFLITVLAARLPAQVAEPTNYLQSVVAELEKTWPANRRVNIVWRVTSRRRWWTLSTPTRTGSMWR